MILRDSLRDISINSGYERFVVPYDEWVLSREPEKYRQLYMGAVHATNRMDKWKVIDDVHFPFPGPELSKNYLKMIWDVQETRYSSARYCRKEARFFRESPPLYHSGYVEGRLANVDIFSAYPQIYTRTCLDLRFDPDGKVFCPGRIKFLYGEELLASKKVSRAVHGFFTPKAINVLEFGKERNFKQRARYAAPGLMGYIFWTLHAIANDMINKFGAVWVHTDGYIMPDQNADSAVEYLAKEWQIDARIKNRGWGFVKAPNCYFLPGKNRGWAESQIPARPVNQVKNLDSGTINWLRLLRRKSF